MILHILNGDCASDGWKQNDFDGEMLVWRENYLHGTMPQTDDITVFNRIRAGELHKISPEIPENEIFSGLQTMHRKLFSLNCDDKVVLWLDCCPFDQALTNRLCSLILSMPEVPELFIVQHDTVWNKESFSQYSNWEDHRYSVSDIDS